MPGSVPERELITDFRRSKDETPGAFPVDRYKKFGLNKIDFHGNNSQVKRCKYNLFGNKKCSKGVHTTFPQEYIMCTQFDPTTDVINYLVYEKDVKAYVKGADGGELIFSNDDGDIKKRGFSYSAKRSGYSAGNVTVASNSARQAETIDGDQWYVHETTTGGELRVKFGYKDN